MPRRFVALLGAALLLSGCEFPVWLVFEPPPITPPAQVSTPAFTPTYQAAATLTPLPPTALPCAYVWGYKDLQDETAHFQDQLVKAGLGRVEAALTAYGETCLDSITNQVIEFTPLQTDFHLAIPVRDARDKDEVGALIRRVLDEINNVSAADAPGTQPGLIELVFGDGREEFRLSFTLDQAMLELTTGQDGAALYELLTASQR